MDLDKIRKLIIAAICSDEVLLNDLVLKGGNALGLVHGIGMRFSVDIDYSISGDFADLEDVESRLFAALSNRFEAHDLVVFDQVFGRKPRRGAMEPLWGGYQAEFKLITKEKFRSLEGSREAMRRQALDVNGMGGSRRFKIDISKHEYTQGKEEAEIEDCTCYVYTVPMIAAEKLRAICQQMEGYDYVKNPRARARDFYDVYSIIDARALNFARPEFLSLVRHVFEAKEVPLFYLAKIEEQYDFHAQDWSAVKDSIVDVTRDFRFYFDFVVKQVEKLKPLWVK